MVAIKTRVDQFTGGMSPRQLLLLGLGAFLVLHLVVWKEETVLVLSSNPSVQVVHSKWRTKAKKCPKQDLETLGKKEQLMSQFKEDVELLGYFNGMCNGKYIEMGGLDGKSGSNTYVFNKAFGWKGFMAELSPSSFKVLQQNRPNELATVNAAVCKTERTLHFYDAGEIRNDPAVNGIWEYSQPDFRNMFWKGATINDCKEVHCSPFQALLDKHLGYSNNTFFDILSLDIEGAELEALQTLDFSRTGFGMIVAENEPIASNMRKTIGLRTLLERNGYNLIKKDDHNEWYVNAHFDEIYAQFIING